MDLLLLTFVTSFRFLVSMLVGQDWLVVSIKEALQNQLTSLQSKSFSLVCGGKTLLDTDTVSACQLTPCNYIFIAINDFTPRDDIPESPDGFSEKTSTPPQRSLQELARSVSSPKPSLDMPALQMGRGEFILLLASLFSVFGIDAEGSLLSNILNRICNQTETGPSELDIVDTTQLSEQIRIAKLEQCISPSHFSASNSNILENSSLDVPVGLVLKDMNQKEAISQLLMNPCLIPIKLESIRLSSGIPPYVNAMIVQMKNMKYEPLFRTLRAMSTIYSTQYGVDPALVDSAVCRWTTILEPLTNDGYLLNRSTAFDYVTLKAQRNIAICRLLKLGYSLGLPQEDVLKRWVQNNLNIENTLFEMMDLQST